MSLIFENKNPELITRSCLAGIDLWMRRIVHHQDNLTIEFPSFTQINFKFLNADVMQNLLVALWWKLHNCSFQEIVEAFASDFKPNFEESDESDDDWVFNVAENYIIDSPSVKEIEVIEEDVKEVNFEIFLIIFCRMIVWMKIV